MGLHKIRSSRNNLSHEILPPHGAGLDGHAASTAVRPHADFEGWVDGAPECEEVG